MKKILVSALISSLIILANSAQASLVALDAWQTDTTLAGGTVPVSVNTNIGHWGFLGGSATVTQEVDASGNPFVGAIFSEFGNIFSVNYILENCVGTCDSGIPQDFANNLNLELVFTGLSGTISAYDSLTGAISFLFDNNVGDVTLRATDSFGAPLGNLATFEIANPSGGTLGNFFGAGGIRGTSNVLGLVTSNIPSLFRDSFGNTLDPLLNQLFLEVDTTNTISSPAIGIGACDLGANCSRLSLTTEGAGNLFVNTVPEPASLVLLGMGLISFGFARRRFV